MPKKTTKDREEQKEKVKEIAFNFPAEGVTIYAKNREEAEKKLQKILNNN